jgi:choline kinase
MNKAIIFVDAKSDDEMKEPVSFLTVGGLSLLARQLKQLKTAGISHVYLMSFSMPEKLHHHLPKFKGIIEKIEVVDANFTDTSFWDALDRVYLVEEGHLIDQRIVDAVVSNDNSNVISLFEENAAMFGEGAGLKVDINGSPRVFASCAVLGGQCLKKASLSPKYKESPVATIIEAMVDDGESVAENVSAIDLYEIDMMADVPILWRPISNKSECKRATKLLIENAQKAVLSWPARFVHPIFENLLVYYSLPTKISPNFLTLLIPLVGFYLAYLFAIGQMGVALSGAMLLGVIYGVRAKLVLIKLQPSNHYSFELIFDNIVEYAWYLSMAFYFSSITGSIGLWAIGWLIIFLSVANTVMISFFRCLTDKQLDDRGVFERALKLVGASRNTRVWALAVFALTLNWETGFWLLAIYTAITFFVYQWRFIVRLKGYASKVSDAFAKNISKTRCFR